MRNLNLHYPLLYTTLNCISCQMLEDIPHLLTCSKQNHNIQQILLLEITNTTQQLNISSNSPNEIYSIILQHFNTSPHISFLNLLQGLIPISLYSNIKTLLHKSTTTFFITLSNNSLNSFHQQIWLPRNTLQHQWENAHNITNKSKHSKIYSLTLPLLTNPLPANTSIIDSTNYIKNWLFLSYFLTNSIF